MDVIFLVTFGLLHSKDILLCDGIPQMSINTTIFLYKLAFLYHITYEKIYNWNWPVSPYKQSKTFSTSLIEWFHHNHCDTVIVVILFHKLHNICNCAFFWNSSSFWWHNVFSINRRNNEVDQEKFVEKIRNGDHVFIPSQYTMCYTKCNAGGLRACSIVLKTQYLLWKAWQSSGFYAKYFK